MKKAICLSVFVASFIFGHAQVTSIKGKPGSVKDTSQRSPRIAPRARQFALILNEDELRGLYDFITNADNFSEKGRQQFLSALDKHLMELPVPVDSTKRK
jgi:hypothetical protein